MPCDIIDFRCVIMNELVGSSLLTVVLGAMLYFIVASKNKLGFDTTIALMIPILLIMGLMFTSFTTILIFASIGVGLLLAWMFQQIIGNR